LDIYVKQTYLSIQPIHHLLELVLLDPEFLTMPLIEDRYLLTRFVAIMNVSHGVHDLVVKFLEVSFTLVGLIELTL
jgi:hypothetical protein